MPKRPIIIQKGAKILKEKTKEVILEEIKTAYIQNIIKKMSEILKEAENGVGLAAPQLGEPLKIFLVSEEVFLEKEVSNLSSEELKKRRQKSWKPLVFINPKITKISSKKNFLLEGCLSIEDVYGRVKRAEKVFFEAYNEKGEKIKRGASGLFAQVIQHEIDHLDGVLFTEKAVEIKKEVKKNKNG